MGKLLECSTQESFGSSGPVLVFVVAAIVDVDDEDDRRFYGSARP